MSADEGLRRLLAAGAHQIITERGSATLGSPKALRAMLLDAAGADSARVTADVDLLVVVAGAGVAALADSVVTEQSVQDLAAELVTPRVTAADARWAIDTWLGAMGVSYPHGPPPDPGPPPEPPPPHDTEPMPSPPGPPPFPPPFPPPGPKPGPKPAVVIAIVIGAFVGLATLAGLAAALIPTTTTTSSKTTRTTGTTTTTTTTTRPTTTTTTKISIDLLLRYRGEYTASEKVVSCKGITDKSLCPRTNDDYEITTDGGVPVVEIDGRAVLSEEVKSKCADALGLDVAAIDVCFSGTSTKEYECQGEPSTASIFFAIPVKSRRHSSSEPVTATVRRYSPSEHCETTDVTATVTLTPK